MKRERAKAGFSLTVLSKKTGISREGINGYERGKYGAWPAKAKLLADALGVPLSQITDEAKTRRAS